MSTARQARIAGAILVALAAALIAPFWLDEYWLGLVTQGLIFALLAASLDLLLGYTGMPSLGHAAFFGIGGYGVGLATVEAGLGGLLPALIAVAAATAAGGLLGLVVLRTRGIAFLMITLALGQVLWGLAAKWDAVTGGTDGIAGIILPEPLGLDLGDPTVFYFVVVAIVAAAIAGLQVLVRSPLGAILQGIRESETRMRQLGYETWPYRWLAFAIAGACAGAAGTLDAYYNQFVSPDSLSVTVSAEVLLMVIIGSSATLWGPAGAAVLLVVLEAEISDHTERWVLVLGALYVLTVLVAPQGLLRLAQERLPWAWQALGRLFRRSAASEQSGKVAD